MKADNDFFKTPVFVTVFRRLQAITHTGAKLLVTSSCLFSLSLAWFSSICRRGPSTGSFAVLWSSATRFRACAPVTPWTPATIHCNQIPELDNMLHSLLIACDPSKDALVNIDSRTPPSPSSHPRSRLGHSEEFAGSFLRKGPGKRDCSNHGSQDSRGIFCRGGLTQ